MKVGFHTREPTFFITFVFAPFRLCVRENSVGHRAKLQLDIEWKSVRKIDNHVSFYDITSVLPNNVILCKKVLLPQNVWIGPFSAVYHSILFELMLSAQFLTSFF